MTRLEDRDLLQGAGTFVDDLRLDGMLHAAVLRSPVAHGRVVRIDPAPALRRRGVVAALTFRDLPQPVPALPNLRPHPALRAATPYPLA
ncbi:MAG: xanthine dehydrogenase family protein molybdopterin-binding subunit, partial [Armatimonadota bacterium]